MLPTSWYPASAKNLVRIGPEKDGGYVVPKSVIRATEVLFGLGVSDDWKFEEEFKKLSNCNVICYDHTVTRRYWQDRLVGDCVEFARNCIAFVKRKPLSGNKLKDMLRFSDYKKFFDGRTATHYQLKIGYDEPGSVSIDSIVEPFKGKNVFLKIDIEGWEYRVMHQLRHHSNYVIGFVIEFHDVDLHRNRISHFIEDLQKFRVVHIHANNYGGVDAQGDPVVLEITFLREDLVEPDSNKFTSYPVAGLDFPNDPSKRDLALRFE